MATGFTFLLLLVAAHEPPERQAVFFQRPPHHVRHFRTWGYVAPPFGPYDPFGYDGFVPYVWYEPAIILPPPIIAMPPAAAPNEPRLPQIVPAAPARGAPTDIPDRVVEDLLGRRRPTLAQRAQSVRLEAAGDLMLRGGHYVRAAERYQQALALTPDDDDAKFKRGAALAASGQYGEAGRALRDALHDRPDWPLVAHDLTTLFPDAAAIARVLDNLEREARQPDAELDVAFLRAYILYFSGQREAAEVILRNPPGGVAPPHYLLFLQAIDRARQ